MEKKNYTIKDIARLAGVSIGTVDRVLHNRGKVSEKSLLRVQEILKEVNYQPNLIARTLKSGKSHKLMVVVPEYQSDDYWRQCNLGLEQAISELEPFGVHVDRIFFDSSSPDSFKKSAMKALQNDPEGLLIAPLYYKESLDVFSACHEKKIPYITINTEIEEVNSLSFIGQDLWQSGRLGARLMHLYLKSPKKIVIIHIDENHDNARHLMKKEEGFRAYFEEKYAEKIQINTIDIKKDSEQMISELRTQLIDDPENCGIYITTSRADTLYEFLKEIKGKSCVVGYDLVKHNIEFLKNDIIDFIIHQNPKRQAYLGLTYLVDHLIFKKSVPKKELLPLDIIMKENLESHLIK